MRSDDISAVAALEKRIFPDPWAEMSFVDLTQDNTSGGFVAEAPPLQGQKEELAGYCCYYWAADEANLTNIAVSPEWRRKGVASALLEVILAEARRVGSAQLYLEVRQSNSAAIRLYEKLGFHESYSRRNYYTLPREDALVMAFDLTEAEQGRPEDRDSGETIDGMV